MTQELITALEGAEEPSVKISCSPQWPTQEMLDDYWRRSMDAARKRHGSGSIRTALKAQEQDNE